MWWMGWYHFDKDFDGFCGKLFDTEEELDQWAKEQGITEYIKEHKEEKVVEV